MQVTLDKDECTKRNLSHGEKPVVQDELRITEEESEKLCAKKRENKALSFADNEVCFQERSPEGITEQIKREQREIEKLDRVNIGALIVKELLAGKNLQEAKQACRDIEEKKEGKREKIISLQHEYAKAVIKKLKADQTKREYRYYCSACLIIRDDNEYLPEWLEWHIGQGIECFYIYDHGSKIPVCETVKSLPQEIKSRLKIHDFGGSHEFAQHEAYNDCLKKYAGESRWIAFIDSDEMIRVKTGQTLQAFLREYEDYAGLFIKWIVYGANGQKNKSDAPCRVRFSKESPSKASENVGKVIVQPAFMRKMLTHNGYTKEGFCVVDEHKRELEQAQIYQPAGTTDLICLDHYYTKSYEEWLNKIKRGSCDPYYSRKYAEFFEYNPDMEYCRESTFPIQEYEISKI